MSENQRELGKVTEEPFEIDRENVRAQISKTLTRYPHFKEFYGDRIESRLEESDWLDCDLVGYLCRPSSTLIPEVERQLKALREDAQAYQIFRMKGDKDTKLSRVLPLMVEMKTYRFLKAEGFVDIKMLPESNVVKVPDFSANLNGRPCFVEAKTITFPGPICELLWNSIAIYRILITPPSIFLNVTVSEDLEKGDVYHNLDKKSFHRFLFGEFEKFFAQGTLLKDIVSDVPQQMLGENKGGHQPRLKISGNSSEWDSLSLGWDQGWREDSEQFEIDLIMGFGRQYFGKLKEALTQIREYAQSKSLNISQYTAMPMIYWLNEGVPGIINYREDISRLANAINKGLPSYCPIISAVYLNDPSGFQS